MLYDPLAVCDPEIAALIELERERQFEGLELIASEVRSIIAHSPHSPMLAELHVVCSDGGEWLHPDQQVF